jgi:hypothetical protein
MGHKACHGKRLPEGPCLPPFAYAALLCHFFVINNDELAVLQFEDHVSLSAYQKSVPLCHLGIVTRSASHI